MPFAAGQPDGAVPPAGMSVLRRLATARRRGRWLPGAGLASLLVACFGGISIVLASITAALCTGKDARPDADKRYVAGLWRRFYLLGATFAGTIAGVQRLSSGTDLAALAVWR